MSSITFSALTVMAALMSLVVAQFGLYQSLGPALAIGIGLMLLAGLTLLPALLAIFGRAVFWPSRTRPEASPRPTLYGRIAGGVVRKPRVVAVVGLLFFAALALGQVGAPAAGFADQSSPSGTDSAAGTAVLTAHFGSGGANANEVLFTFDQSIYTHPADLVSLESDLRATGKFATISGPVEVVQAAGGLPALQQAATGGAGSAQQPLLRSLSRFISADGRTVQVQTLFINSNSSDPAAIAAVPAVRAAVTEVAQQVHATDSGVFGILPFAYDVNAVSASDLSHILPLVAVLIAILLAIVLRSLLAPLYLVSSVVLSYLSAIGITALVFVHFGGQSGINFVLPFLMFVFLMALGSDYNILVMTRIREEAQRLPLLAAIRHAVARDRHHRDHRRCDPRRDVRGARRRRWEHVGRRPDQADRLRHRRRCAHGHVPGAHHPGPVVRRDPGALELVAVVALPHRPHRSRLRSAADRHGRVATRRSR